MDSVQEELTKARKEIANCQKIKTANRSEYIWGMVEAYECDELADDSSRWKTNGEIQVGSWEECYKEE